MVFTYASIIHERAGDSNTICDYFCKFSLNSDPIRDNIVDVMLSCWGGLPVILLVALPQIQQQAKRHQPHLNLRQMKVGKAVIEKSGEHLRIALRIQTQADSAGDGLGGIVGKGGHTVHDRFGQLGGMNILQIVFDFIAHRCKR